MAIFTKWIHRVNGDVTDSERKRRSHRLYRTRSTARGGLSTRRVACENR